MTDVIKKIYSNKAQHNGYAIVGGNQSVLSSGILLRPRNHYPVECSGIRADLETRFDDVRYYEGDTAS